MSWVWGKPDRNDNHWYQTKDNWICTKYMVNGVPQYELWRDKVRYPETGGFASAEAAMSMVETIEEFE